MAPCLMIHGCVLRELTTALKKDHYKQSQKKYTGKFFRSL